MKTGFNVFRCGTCGVAWDEHPRDTVCDRYRPPMTPEIREIKKKLIKLVNRNIDKS